MKNKIISVLFLICLMMINMFSLALGAENNEIVCLRSEKKSDTKQIKLIIDINNFEKGALGMQGTIKFDSDSLELVEAKVNDENWRMTALNKENGKFIVEISDEAFFNQDMYLYEKEGFIEFVFNDLKKLNNCDILATEMKLVDSNFETIELSDVEINVKSINGIVIFIVVCVLLLLVLIKRRINRKNK